MGQDGSLLQVVTDCNFDKGSKCYLSIEKRQRFPSGEMDARLDIKQGVIQSVKFYGDFFAGAEPEALAHLLIGGYFVAHQQAPWYRKHYRFW